MMQNFFASLRLLIHSSLAWAGLCGATPLDYDVWVPASAVKEKLLPAGHNNLDGRVAGVEMVSGSLSSNLRPVMSIYGLDKADTHICVRIVSINNLYTAQFSFTNLKAAGTVRVKFDARRFETIAQREEGEFAIRVWPSKQVRCVEHDLYLLANWGQPIDGRELRVSYNAGQAATVRAQINELPTSACRRIREIVGKSMIMDSAYNHFCNMSLFREKCGNQRLVVQGNIGPENLDPTRITVRTACVLTRR